MVPDVGAKPVFVRMSIGTTPWQAGPISVRRVITKSQFWQVVSVVVI